MEKHESLGWPLELPLDEGVLDESTKFEKGDQSQRLDLISAVLQNRAASFKLPDEGLSLDKKHHLLFPQKRKGGPMARAQEDHSLFGSAICLPELVRIVPLAVAAPAHQRQLSAEVLVKALLFAPHGPPILLSTLKAQPPLRDPAIQLLAQIAAQATPPPPPPPPPPVSAPPPSTTVHHHPLSRVPAGSQNANPSASQPSAIPRVGLLDSMSARWRTVSGAVTAVLVPLCHQSSEIAATCRRALVQSRALPELVLHITSTVCRDDLPFLSSFLFSSPQPAAATQWLLAELAAPNRTGLLGGGGKGGAGAGAGAGTREVLFQDAQREVVQCGWSDVSHAHLRLYCALVRMAPLKPTPGEIHMWLSALSSPPPEPPPIHPTPDPPPPPRLPAGDTTLKLGLAFFCLVPGLSAVSVRGMFHRAVARVMGGVEGDMRVWLALQILLKNFPQIAAVVRSVVGVHVTISNAALEEVAEASSAEGGPVADPGALLRAVTTLRSMKTIRGNRDPVHGVVAAPGPCEVADCLLQLVGRYGVGVDTSDAVAHCLMQAGLPLHPTLPALVSAYVDATAAPIRPRVPSANAHAPGGTGGKALPLGSLMALLQPACEDIVLDRPVSDCHLARAALGSYYLLCKEQGRGGGAGGGGGLVRVYGRGAQKGEGGG